MRSCGSRQSLGRGLLRGRSGLGAAFPSNGTVARHNLPVGALRHVAVRIRFPLRVCRWTLAFNIDLVGLSSYRPAGVTAVSSSQSRFGQHARYWTYALPWALTMMVTVALPTALHFVFQRRLSVRLNAIVAFARNVALMCAVLLYTPVCVALSRLYGIRSLRLL